MTFKLSHSISKTILLSIPSLFDDGRCRPFKLLAVELHGLWLESDALTARLLPEDAGEYASASASVFVPFAQIAAVLVVTSVTAKTAGSGKSVPEQSTKSAAARPDSAASRAKRKK